MECNKSLDLREQIMSNTSLSLAMEAIKINNEARRIERERVLEILQERRKHLQNWEWRFGDDNRYDLLRLFDEIIDQVKGD